ncbi:MAG: hypothetical protein OEY14_16130, partial [Myxococcales bacterium]|nr:hypothetical protein [Myxococcales bacterium]
MYLFHAARTLLLCAALSLLQGEWSDPAHAQGSDAEARAAAGEAYNRGSTAWLARRWARAAEWFETAHRLAPSATALTQAVRSHGRAGHALRAGTLGLRLLAEFPDDPEAQRVGRLAASDAETRFVRVEITCSG